LIGTAFLIAMLGALSWGCAFAQANAAAEDSTSLNAPAAAESRDERGAQSDDAANEPLRLYLESLSDSAASSFHDPSLDALSISDAEVDSLIRLYERGGAAAEESGEPTWRASFGLGGARYNRVEGLNIIPRASLRPPVSPPLEISGHIGYGWSAKEVTGGMNVNAQVSSHAARPTLHVSWAREVYAYGSGIVAGNSLTALMIGKDYSDYFRGQGWVAGLSVAPHPFELDVSFRAEQQKSLSNAAAFTFFEGDDEFRPNPPIDDGDDHLVQVRGSWGDRPQAPWNASVSTGFARPGLGGDFDYETVRGEVGMRRRIWLGDRIVTSLSGGWIGGDAPFQAAHHLGGFERLRGYQVNEFTTREFAHLRFDYEVGSDPLSWVPYVRRLRIQPIAFADAAAIFEGQARSGDPVPLESPEWKFATGFGLQNNLLGIPGRGGQLRFDIARRLDREDDAMTYRIRFTFRRE
jgi:hypothetical protein